MQEHLRNLTNHGLAPGTLGLCIIVKNNYLCNIILSLSILNYPFLKLMIHNIHQEKQQKGKDLLPLLMENNQENKTRSYKMRGVTLCSEDSELLLPYVNSLKESAAQHAY